MGSKMRSQNAGRFVEILSILRCASNTKIVYSSKKTTPLVLAKEVVLFLTGSTPSSVFSVCGIRYILGILILSMARP
jgi:hypothetical protein